MKKFVFASLFIISLVCSCSESETRKTLKSIENIIEENIDSAKVLLSTIDKGSITNKKDAADYSLYNTIITMRFTHSYDSLANYDLITPAVEYYKNV